MDSSTTIQPASRKRLAHTVLSMLVIALGAALLVYMITVEDEPGAVPLLMIAAGIGWLVFARVRLRPEPKS